MEREIETKWKQELSAIAKENIDVAYYAKEKQIAAKGNYKAINKIYNYYAKKNKGLKEKEAFGMHENIYKEDEFLFFLSLDPSVKAKRGAPVGFVYY